MDTENPFKLNFKDKDKLLQIARQTIEEYIRYGKKISINESSLSDILKTKCGVFVTLHKNNMLRGCIGRFNDTDPLFIIVQKMAISASSQDPRFPAVTTEELDKIKIEISVLTPLKKINSIDEFILKKHGIYIKKWHSSGTFLPQVANQTEWTKEEFLGHCAQDKAEIGWNGWKDAELFTYEAIIFSEK